MLRGRLVLFGREVIDLSMGRTSEEDRAPEEGPLPQPCADPACSVCPGLTEPEPPKVPLGFTRPTAEVIHLPRDLP